MIDIQNKKKKILEFLNSNGPSLPVQVAKAIQMEPVFASAILSELLSSRQIKTSQMKIGASPLYLIPGQEEKLESKTEHLKPAEKEAQEKLKSKKILTDESEEPATRVALRNIRDFATPFKFKEKIMWKYSFTPQKEIDDILFPKKEEKEEVKEEIKEEKKKEIKEEEEVPKAWVVKKEEIKEIKKESKKIENIFNEKKVPVEKKEPKEKKESQKSFLIEIEEFLKSQNTSISSLEEVDKKKVTAIVEKENKKSMLFAFNKAKINETELLKCYKEADKKSLPYQIITKSSLSKKLTDTIRAYQRLLRVDNLEN